MIRFLLRGLIRDRSRSLFPIMVIVMGVVLVVAMDAYMGGALSMIHDSNARLSTGHVKIETRAAVQENQKGSIDLALLNNQQLLDELKKMAPEIDFHERIYFGALADVPDKKGETKAQGPASGIGLDLFSASNEIKIMKLRESLSEGRLPNKSGEILLGKTFKENLNLQLNHKLTLIGSDLEGGMAVGNFTVVGVIRFGIRSMDRSTVIMDLQDARNLLALQDGATEIFGFYKDGNYYYHRPEKLEQEFNRRYSKPDDPYSPQMRIMEQQNDLETILKIYNNVLAYVDGIFIFIMGIVLWNTGLMSGIRRYGEFGVRLAMGETKRHVYTSLIIEGLMVGIAGTILGTLIGLCPAYYLDIVGINIGDMLQNDMSMLFEDHIYAKVTVGTYFSGIIPGILAPFLGSLVSGFAIFRRDTSRLFVELEV